MTDNEIIKALECCIESTSRNDCEDLKCPACDEIGCYFMHQSTEYYPESLIQEMGKAVLDLINRQKAEIERWKEQNVRLDKECDHFIRFASAAKSEAYKEFAERFKWYVTLAESKPTTRLSYSSQGIVNMVDFVCKELTEGGNEDG